MRQVLVCGIFAAIVAIAVLFVNRENVIVPPSEGDVPRSGALPTGDTSQATGSLANATVDPVRVEVEVDPAAAPTTQAAVSALTVIVVDGDSGTRVPGAKVTVTFGFEFVPEPTAGASALASAAPSLRQQPPQHAVADANGEARIDIPRSSFTLEARSETRWGRTVLKEPPTDGRVTVTIGPDFTLRAQVVDATDTPRVGVPVSLRRETLPPPRQRLSERTELTEALDGIATFEHFQRRLEQGDGWHLTFAFPVRDAPMVRVDRRTPPSPPQRLVLPPTGRLRLTVRDTEGAVPPLDNLELRVEVEGDETWPRGPWSRPRLDPATGTANVAFLGLGFDLRVTARRGRAVIAAATVPGPRVATEEATCDLVLGALPGGVRGRLVFANGRPWPATSIDVFLVPRLGSLTPRLQHGIPVGADGRFVFAVEPEDVAGGETEWSLHGSHPDGSGMLKAKVTIDYVPPEGLDLGDVCLDHGLLLAAGHVLGPDQRPLAYAQLQLFAITEVDGKKYWPQVGVTRTSHDGAFRLSLQHGDDDPGARLRLNASCVGHVQIRHLPVDRGDDNVIVRMDRAGSIAGSFALSGGLAGTDLVVCLRGESTSPDEDAPLRFAPGAKDATFAVGDLPSGTWTLTVRRRGTSSAARPPLAIVEGLFVRAGEACRDPRIQHLPIALPGTTLRITVIDENGTPLKDAAVTVLGKPDADRSKADRDGVCLVQTGSLPLDLKVTAFGCRPQRLRGVDRDQKIVMQGGIPVVLRCGTTPGDNDPTWQLSVDLYHVGADGKTGRRVFDLTDQPQKRYFDAHGELSLSLPGPGVYECAPHVFVLADSIGRSGNVEMEPQPRITVLEGTTIQAFDLQIPGDAVRRAVERAAK